MTTHVLFLYNNLKDVCSELGCDLGNKSSLMSFIVLLLKHYTG